MRMYRYRKNSREFWKQRDRTDCALCDPGELIVIQEYPHSLLVHNKYPYDVWEGRKVIEHRMLLPKRHLPGFGQFSDDERSEVLNLIAEHEADGFDVYARGVGSAQKTVHAHQHTHLIKVEPAAPKLLFYLAKPYLLLKR